nr:ABC transporter permease [Flexivirga aerilata]
MPDTRTARASAAARSRLAAIARRVAQVLFVLWGAFTGAFLALYRMPSDPVTLMLAQRSGGSTVVDPEQAAQLRAEYGFDQPVWRQYLGLLGRALHGDLGRSVQTGEPVIGLIGQALPQTVEIAVFALIVAVPLGVALPVLSALTGNSLLRGLLDSIPAFGVAMPSFWVGILLLQLFSFHWAVFPSTGNQGFAALVLPSLTLAVPTAAVLAQIVGRGIRENLRRNYVELVRAKGAGRVRVVLRHLLRNASLPALTVTGLLVANLLGGAVVVETVFARAGLGQLTVTAVTNEDLPVILGLVVLSAAVYAAVSLLLEVVYPLVDPRAAGARRAAGRA